MTARWPVLLLLAVLVLSVPGRVLAQADTTRRAAVLVYRQALHTDGAALDLAARVLTERAAADVDADGLSQLRKRVLEAGRGVAYPPLRVPGRSSDQVAAMIARHDPGSRRSAAAPDLLAAWQARERRDELAGLLPYLLAEAESRAGAIWREALAAAADDAALATALAPLVRELAGAAPDAPMDAWLAVEPALSPAQLAVDPGRSWRATARAALESALADPGAVSPEITARLRAQWFLTSRSAASDPVGSALAGLWIGLRANTARLADADPVPFLAALVAGTQQIALGGDSLSATDRRDLDATVSMLRSLPEATVDGWSAVDRRLPGIFRAVVVQLAGASGEAGSLSAGELQLAGARLTLLDDDWEAYLMQPFREPIQQALAACLPAREESVAGCRVRFQDWGLQGAGIPEASGDTGGPFQAEYLLRELELNPWQRINYLRGFWRDLLARGCSERDQVSNALEWALAARGYLATLPAGATAEDESLQAGLSRLADAGMSLVGDLRDFGACRAQGRGPVRQVLAAYAAAVNRLPGALDRAGRAFREQVLVDGADIALDAGADQPTEYAPPSLTAAPCGGTPACGVSADLPVSRALYERFPAPYRVADQSGLGTLAICYGDVSWVDRRAVPVSSGGGVMANYRGRLSFRLRGQFSTGGETRDVFVLRLVSETEHTYLFAPDRPAVLADPCPQEYPGRMAAGELPEARGWLVPRRLTYLSGERSSPARLFAENWTRGGDWLGRLARGEGVSVERQASGEAVAPGVTAHLEDLLARRRAHLYERLLAPMAADADANGEAARELTATALQVSAMRRALDASVRVLTPLTVMGAPRYRGALYGNEALVGPAAIRAWRDQARDPLAIPAHARDRIEWATEVWRDPAAGMEIPPFVAHALIDLLAASRPVPGVEETVGPGISPAASGVP